MRLFTRKNSLIFSKIISRPAPWIIASVAMFFMVAPAWAVSADSFRDFFNKPAPQPPAAVKKFAPVVKVFDFSVDLSAKDLRWDAAAKNSRVIVKNIGVAPSNAVRVTFTLFGKKGSAVFAVSPADPGNPTEDDGLEAGEERAYQHIFSAAALKSAGNVTKLVAKVDSFSPLEKDTANNTATLMVAPPSPPLAPSAAITKNLIDSLMKNAAIEKKPANIAAPAAAEPAGPATKEAAPTGDELALPPKKPTLKEPADGGSVTSVTPVLNWTDNGPGKNYFRWYVLNPDSNQKVWERDWDRGEFADKGCLNALNQWICQYATVPAGKLNFDQSYKWTVEASDDKSSSGFATSSQFNVKYEYVPIKFKAAPAETSAPTCNSPQYWNGSACTCGDLSPAPAPTYCCPVGRIWNGTACVSVG